AGWFGLEIPPPGPEIHDDPSPLVRKARRVRGVMREVLIGYLAICAVSQALKENKSLPAVIREHRQPKFMEATIVYFRIFQGWGMFAPNPITDDGSLTVDAWTIDGRHVDPF